MDIEFNDGDFSDIEETPAITAIGNLPNISENSDDSNLGQPSSPKPPREPAVAADNPPLGIAKATKLCVDNQILAGYRTIGFVSKEKTDTVFLMVAPEGTYFSEGRNRNTRAYPGKDDAVPRRVFLILLEDVTLELCQFDVTFTISVESYSCSCNVFLHRVCTTKKTKMAFVSDGKPEDAPRCLLYRAIPSSPPSVRQWYPHDIDTVHAHHQLRSHFRLSFSGNGTASDDDSDENVGTGETKTYIDDDTTTTSSSTHVSSKSQDAYEKLQARKSGYPFATTHELVSRIDATIFYEQALGRTHPVHFQKNSRAHDVTFAQSQSFFMFPLLERFFFALGEDVVIPTVKMQTARRVARIMDAAYECDPHWSRSVKSRKKPLAIDEDVTKASNRKGKSVRIPVAFVLALAFWESPEDLSTLPTIEPPPLEWPCGVNRPSYQLGITSTKAESDALEKVLTHSTFSVRQIGLARNPGAISECILKFARRHNQRLPYLYAGRLDADVASERRKIIRFCRHYGFSVEVATRPFFRSCIRPRDKPDMVRFARLVTLLMDLAKHSASNAAFSYDRLCDVDTRGASCDIPAVTPRRVALQVANACTITVLPGTDPREKGVCHTYGMIVRYLKAYVSIRDMSNTEAAASAKKAPGKLQLERIKTKRVVFSGHDALMEMFARHFHWNTKDREEYESVLIRTGVFLDGISYCNLRKLEVNPVTIGTKQFRDAFAHIDISEVPASFFDPEKSANFKTAVRLCVPSEVVVKGVHFEWTDSSRIEEATVYGSTVDARFFVLYDQDTWRALDTIQTKLPGILNEFNIRLNAEMLSANVPNHHHAVTQNMALANILSSIEEAGNRMVIVPGTLGHLHVESLRRLVRQVYGDIDKDDEFDKFFDEAAFIVQSHEIKDSLASNSKMKGCDIVLAASHLLGLREFLDIITRIIRETTPLRITTAGKRPEKLMTIYFSGFVYGTAPGKKSALSALMRSSLELDSTITPEPEPDICMKALCACSVLWVGHNDTAAESSPKHRRVDATRPPSYLNENPNFTPIRQALEIASTAIVSTLDPYAPTEVLQCIGTDYRRVYIDSFVKVSRYGVPTLPYGSSELFATKQANQKFWTGATFLRSVNDFPGQDPYNFDPNANIVVSISRVALEYSCANRRQLLWLLSRARIVILTDVGNTRKRFQEIKPPTPEEGVASKPYMAATEIKRAFGGTTIVLEKDQPGSVERYLRDMFGAL